MMSTLFRSSLLLLTASIVLPACASRSPEAFIEKSMKLGCQYQEQCEPDLYEMGGWDSPNDCADQLLSANFDGEGTFKDLFVDSCSDFDSGKARTCLKAARAAKRSCEMNEEPACQEVCGDQNMGQLLRDPANTELIARVMEEAVLNGDYEPEPAEEVVDELVSEDDFEELEDGFDELEDLSDELVSE